LKSCTCLAVLTLPRLKHTPKYAMANTRLI
jgi:hypothetical protein